MINQLNRGVCATLQALSTQSVFRFFSVLLAVFAPPVAIQPLGSGPASLFADLTHSLIALPSLWLSSH